MKVYLFRKDHIFLNNKVCIIFHYPNFFMMIFFLSQFNRFIIFKNSLNPSFFFFFFLKYPLSFQLISNKLTSFQHLIFFFQDLNSFIFFMNDIF